MLVNELSESNSFKEINNINYQSTIFKGVQKKLCLLRLILTVNVLLRNKVPHL